jgi:hypothetical protein
MEPKTTTGTPITADDIAIVREVFESFIALAEDEGDQTLGRILRGYILDSQPFAAIAGELGMSANEVEARFIVWRKPVIQALKRTQTERQTV